MVILKRCPVLFRLSILSLLGVTTAHAAPPTTSIPLSCHGETHNRGEDRVMVLDIKTKVLSVEGRMKPVLMIESGQIPYPGAETIPTGSGYRVITDQNSSFPGFKMVSSSTPVESPEPGAVTSAEYTLRVLSNTRPETNVVAPATWTVKTVWYLGPEDGSIESSEDYTLDCTFL